MQHRSDIPEGTVTVLFTDLVESTQLNQLLGDEEARAIGRATERLALERVEAHRGVLVKELGDGLMAVFTSARRAVNCAREIQLDMARRNRRESARPVHMRIGLHTGEIIEEDGDIHGETVIIARRIESLAPPGGILASETVHMVLGTARDELDDRGMFDLKGISSPWHLYEVPCHDPELPAVQQVTMTPYVGRVAERTRLLDLVGRVAGGVGGLVLISGEAGAGKSRLASEALDEAQRQGLNVLTGACLDMAVPPPYQPLIDQLEQAARQISRERMREILGENAPEVATLMPSLRQRYRDIARTPDLPPEQERRYVLHGIREFLQRAARIRPQVLLYEDLHWADESTLLLLEHLAAELVAERILVIGTYRSTDLAPERPFARSLAHLARLRDVTEILLPPLDREDIAQLLHDQVGSTPPGALVDLVYAESDGNPFFAEETVRHLLETGRLFDDAGRWRTAGSLGETEVPRTVAMLVGRRLDELQPATRKVLAAAAVIGRVFPFQLLATISATDDDALFDALEDAERHHIIVEDAHGGAAHHRFVHEHFRHVLLLEFALPRRQRLHLLTADAIEAAARPGGSASFAEIANHLELAGSASSPSRTAAALVASAQAALAALAFEDSVARPGTCRGARRERGSRGVGDDRRAAGDRPARQRSRGRGAGRAGLGVARGPRRSHPRRDPPAAKSSAARSVPRLGGPRRPARRSGATPVRRRPARRAGGTARAGARRVHPVARPPGVRALGARHVRGGVAPRGASRGPAVDGQRADPDRVVQRLLERVRTDRAGERGPRRSNWPAPSATRICSSTPSSPSSARSRPPP